MLGTRAVKVRPVPVHRAELGGRLGAAVAGERLLGGDDDFFSFSFWGSGLSLTACNSMAVASRQCTRWRQQQLQAMAVNVVVVLRSGPEAVATNFWGFVGTNKDDLLSVNSVVVTPWVSGIDSCSSEPPSGVTARPTGPHCTDHAPFGCLRSGNALQ